MPSTVVTPTVLRTWGPSLGKRRASPRVFPLRNVFDYLAPRCKARWSRKYSGSCTRHKRGPESFWRGTCQNPRWLNVGFRATGVASFVPCGYTSRSEEGSFGGLEGASPMTARLRLSRSSSQSPLLPPCTPTTRDLSTWTTGMMSFCVAPSSDGNGGEVISERWETS